ncbi:MAG: hypothetical protein ACYCZN_15965 [Candidatus Dormibacteria bacterium]
MVTLGSLAIYDSVRAYGGRERVQIRCGGGGDGSPDPFDPITGVTQARGTIDFAAQGEPAIHVEETVPTRIWSDTELADAIRPAGRFEVRSQYGSSQGLPLTDPDVWRMITVLGLTQTSQPASGPVDAEQEAVGP